LQDRKSVAVCVEGGEAVLHLTRNHQNSWLLAPSAGFAADRPDDGVVGTETASTMPVRSAR
jgi:hypothetical protein